MKTYLSIAALLAAGAAFANAASVTHGDGTPVEEMMSGYYVLEGETPYSDVSISADAGDSEFSVMVGMLGAGTVTGGVTISNASSSTVNFSLYEGSLSGKVTSAGSTGSVNISLYTGTSLGAGTSFELSASSTLNFGANIQNSSVTWNLSKDDVANQNVLISGSGAVTFSENATIVLNFESEAALNAVMANSASFQLFGDGVSATGLSNASWTVQVAGADTGSTLSVNEDGVATVVPEPSAFGLLAGLGALALVASRRRRTKRA